MALRIIHFLLLSVILYQAIASPNHASRSRLRQPKIFGGSKAQENQYPWQVSITSCNNLMQCNVCGGSLISPWYVLTAAHCTYNLKQFDIGLGSNLYFEPQVEIKAFTKFEHPDYNKQLILNDIAIIKLTKPVQLSSSIQTVKLPKQSFDNLMGQHVAVSGFGKTPEESISRDLKVVDMKIVPNSQCTMFYTPARVKNTSLCAMGIKNKIDNICKGDSGGPMVVRQDGGSALQVGIVSFFVSECSPDMPSVYTKVSAYIDWIKQVTGLPL